MTLLTEGVVEQQPSLTTEELQNFRYKMKALANIVTIKKLSNYVYILPVKQVPVEDYGQGLFGKLD